MSSKPMGLVRENRNARKAAPQNLKSPRSHTTAAGGSIFYIFICQTMGY